MMTPEDRLRALGLSLPETAAPVANYCPFARDGDLLLVSGQLPFGLDGKIAQRFIGKLGREVFHETGQEAARLCALNALAQARAAVGDLSRIARCLRLAGFINCAPDFTALAAVMNGASDLMVAVLGEQGRHARTTIGVAQIPLGAAVEVEAIFVVAK